MVTMARNFFDRLNELAKKYNIESNLTELSSFHDVTNVYESVRKNMAYPEKRALDIDFNKYDIFYLGCGNNDAYLKSLNHLLNYKNFCIAHLKPNKR